VAVVVLALAQGHETMIGWDKGGGSVAVARRRTRVAWATALAATGISVMLWLAAPVLTGMFSASAEVAAQVGVLLGVAIAAAPLQAVGTIVFSSLRSVGDVTVPVLVSVGTTFLVTLPLSAMLVPDEPVGPLPAAGLGVVGVFIALLVAEAARALGWAPAGSAGVGSASTWCSRRHPRLDLAAASTPTVVPVPDEASIANWRGCPASPAARCATTTTSACSGRAGWRRTATGTTTATPWCGCSESCCCASSACRCRWSGTSSTASATTWPRSAGT
jgi:hypothetical protein